LTTGCTTKIPQQGQLEQQRQETSDGKPGHRWTQMNEEHKVFTMRFYLSFIDFLSKACKEATVDQWHAWCRQWHPWCRQWHPWCRQWHPEACQTHLGSSVPRKRFDRQDRYSTQLDNQHERAIEEKPWSNSCSISLQIGWGIKLPNGLIASGEHKVRETGDVKHR
jgi:hypothetical protein